MRELCEFNDTDDPDAQFITGEIAYNQSRKLWVIDGEKL